MLSGIKRIFSKPKESPDFEHDVILTGLPRTGTTLACRLLSQCDNTIGLNEPMGREYFDNKALALQNIDEAFINFRYSLLISGKAKARTSSGKISDNAFELKKGGKRRRIIERTEVKFKKPLKDDFTLVMKHCAEFSLILPELTKKYRCYALIRNPLAVLGSWNSVNVPVSRGRVAKSAKLNIAFHDDMMAIASLHERQIFIMDWYYSQFLALPTEQVLRYESLTESGGSDLNVITTNAASLKEALKNKNQSELYDKKDIEKLGRLLLESDGAYWKFFQKSEVESLLNFYLSSDE